MDNFWSDFLQNILMAFVPIIASLVAAWLFAQFKLAWVRFQERRPDLAGNMEWAARVAVQASEQAGAAKLIDDKKQYALQVAETWLRLRGFKTIDLFALDAAIESAVYAELNSDKSALSSAHIGYPLPQG
jgi:hypothetical protein